MKSYDIAQICSNGHVVNDSTQNRPDDSKNYCDSCGENTIKSCTNCQVDIQGAQWLHKQGPLKPVVASLKMPPAYCRNCGAAFPWTERKLSAAAELARLEIEDHDDAAAFERDMAEIIKDTPQAPVAATRIGKLCRKYGPTLTKLTRNMIVDVASESVWKIFQALTGCGP